MIAQRLVALFVLGCLLLSYPLLSLFNTGGTLWGIPLLYIYLFGAWAALIALMDEFHKAIVKGSGEETARVIDARARELIG